MVGSYYAKSRLLNHDGCTSSNWRIYKRIIPFAFGLANLANQGRFGTPRAVLSKQSTEPSF
jgi:hypothetical protein